MILGGVARDHLLQSEDELLLFSLSPDGPTINRTTLLLPGLAGRVTPRPLLVGHSAICMPDRCVVVVGGGATCFSMGTFWNSGAYTIRIPDPLQQDRVLPLPTGWVHQRTIDIVPGEGILPVARGTRGAGNLATIKSIVRRRLQTAEDFVEVVRGGQPAVLEGLDLGKCVSAWTLDYLVDKVGKDRKVIDSPRSPTPGLPEKVR